MSEPNPTQTDRLIEATREEARKTRTLLLWLLVGIPAIALVIWGIVAAASAVAVHNANTLSNDDTCSDYSTAIHQNPDEATTWEESLNLTPDQSTNLVAECVDHPDETLGDAVSAVQSPNWTDSSDQPTSDAVPEPTTTTPAAMVSFTITDGTMCSAVADWDGYHSTPLNPADAPIEDGYLYMGGGPLVQYLTSKGDPNAEADIGSFINQCVAHAGTGPLDIEKDETVLTAWQQMQSGTP